MKYFLAVDIGASSGRHILGHLERGQVFLEEVYRFPNGAKMKQGRLTWDLEALASHVTEGMAACKKLGKIPATVGIDTWGVDFVLLDKNNRLLDDAVTYRDSRTQGMDSVVEGLVPREELYKITGIQKQLINTIYQLMAVKTTQPGLLDRAHRLLMVPDYLHYLLTGRQVNEYTEASTSGLLNAAAKTWDQPLLDRLGLPGDLFLPPTAPGERLGGLLPEIQERTGYNCQVVLPASHDTGSAFLAVPAKDGNAAYLSSGTWSLLGTELPEPITTQESRKANFSNEGGYQYRYRYLKNIMGLWMLQNLRRELSVEGKEVSFGQVAAMAQKEADFASRVDVNDNGFLAPESMTQAVADYCRGTGQPVPETGGQTAACIYHSLAEGYAGAIEQLGQLTGREITAVNIVGGGSQDGYLNQLTANATGLPVYAGPTEGTALGNLMVQMMAQEELKDLDEAREVERNSFEIKEYYPQ